MQNFTEPEALESLHTLENVEIRMYRTKKANTGFHTKGYIFRHGDMYHIIIGSSNLTQNALTKQKEWNTKLISNSDGAYIIKILKQFDDLWNDTNTECYENFIYEYKNIYNEQKKKKKIIDYVLSKLELDGENHDIEEKLIEAKNKQGMLGLLKGILDDNIKASIDVGKLINTIDDAFNNTTSEFIEEKQREVTSKKKIVNIEDYKLKPNNMQNEFVTNTVDFINSGKSKALLISATGTGKTYASAFLVRELFCKKMLFISHSERINKQAMQAYKKVFEDNKMMALLSGNTDKENCYNSDFVFANVQTLSKEDIINRFSKTEFDIIIIDEAHHINGNDSSCYNKVLSYFTPNKLLLGMTATPERLDNFNIYEIFDYNIAYEIRLNEALENGYLCPFHYYALADMQIDGKDIDNITDFNSLSFEKRVKHIIEESKYFGYSGKRLKGLIFCSRNAECNAIASIINNYKFDETRNYRAVSLGNESNLDDILDRLESDYRNDFIDYVISVDKIGEGIDVKTINQIIMLRPTESVRIFIQQLGRGLRLSNDKEHLIVLDFILNCKNDYMIPMALYGDKTYNKDNHRRLIEEGNRYIEGETSVYFDEISKQRIYKAIDITNYSEKKLIRDAYKNFKNKLGRIPTILDFDNCDELDVLRIIENKDYCSYHNFLVNEEPDYTIRFDEYKEKVIQYFSKKILSGKRINEIIVFEGIIKGDFNFENTIDRIRNEYGIKVDENMKTNLLNLFNNEFNISTEHDKYEKVIILENKDGIKVSDEISSALEDDDFRKVLSEMITFAKQRYEKNYANRYKDTNFVLYKKYTYEEVCRLLNWPKNMNAQSIGGYYHEKTTNTYPIFINYHKSKDISESINYNDRFIDNSHLISMSKNNRSISSHYVQSMIHANENGTKIYLFVKKNKGDEGSKEFYFLGDMEMNGEAKELLERKEVELSWVLDVPVKNDIYDYIVKSGD